MNNNLLILSCFGLSIFFAYEFAESSNYFYFGMQIIFALAGVGALFGKAKML